MNKNAIKRYAIWARNELIDRVSHRAAVYGITDEDHGDMNADSVNGSILTVTEKRQRQALIRKVNAQGYQIVMEEVAFTWFNRFAALRFMEVNGYLPSHVRVFTNDEGEFKPQMLTEAIHLELDGLDKGKVFALEKANQRDDLFKYLLITQCNALSAILPGLFQKIDDYTELLLPDFLLREGSVIQQMVELIPEEDWTDQVQIIGWLYQYYNTEPKDKVFSRPSGQKINKQDIPAATQLFTPDWIVRYMVENSLGRLYVEREMANVKCETEEERPAAQKQIADRMGWQYYLPEAPQEPEVREKLNELGKKSSHSPLPTSHSPLPTSHSLKPENIRVIDPCMGSGHILCYLFDVLVQIYEAYGYSVREAVRLIVEKNLYGLDLDERAGQLAYFAVMMKARQYDRRFFSRDVQPNIGHFQGFTPYRAEDFSDPALQSLVKAFENADEYGSLLEIKDLDLEAAANAVDSYTDDFLVGLDAREKLLRMVQLARMLSQKYDVVVTNPPYMGSSNMYDGLNKFIKERYADYKSDFFSAFIVRVSNMTKAAGYCGFFTPYVWMFIQSYENLRQYLYNSCTIETLIQFEYSAFEEATVPVCTFAFKNSQVKRKKGAYLRLTDFRGGMEVQRQKTLEAIGNHQCGFYYEQTSDNFAKIPGAPVAYWQPSVFFETFKKEQPIGNILDVRKGLTTANNDRFIRFWWEIAIERSNIFPSNNSPIWWRTHKGGEYRKWYGNLENLVDWGNNGLNLKNFSSSVIRNENYYGKTCISWNDISSSKTGFRFVEAGSISNASGPSMYGSNDNLLYSLALCNSVVSSNIMSVLCPTIHFEIGQISKIPLIIDKVRFCTIKELSIQNISLSRADWDSFETSWDFKKHPLIRGVGSVEEAFAQWQVECSDRFHQLKANEEELNRIFIDIYGLQDELAPEVEDKDVTVRKADLQREIKSLISYAVGCMFGRYSLDVDGLAYAGGDWDSSKYVTFQPDKDGILPITDDEYFEDDIVALFVKFIETVFGSETLEDNLWFIADALGKKGSPREVIRNYFINDFFADHCKIYQKRPIYWLFDSGKKNGFKCLIYLHRYRRDTVARVRTDYVHELQSRYRTAMADLEKRISGASTSDKVRLTKQLTTMQGQADELRAYEEKIHHLADRMMEIDLDDGVKVNYAKFADVLAKIK